MQATLEGEAVVCRVPLTEIDVIPLLLVRDSEPDTLLRPDYVPRAYALSRLGLLEWVDDGDGYWDVTPEGHAVLERLAHTMERD